jgi:hypothetical protein
VTHICSRRCKKILREIAKGGPRPVWNGLTYSEQQVWGGQNHRRNPFVTFFGRIWRALRVLVGVE